MSNGMGVKRSVMMTRLTPLSTYSQYSGLIGCGMWINSRLLLLLLLLYVIQFIKAVN